MFNLSTELTLALSISYPLLVLIAVIHMLYRQRSPQSLMAWLMALLLLPFFGLLLYLVLGVRKTHQPQYQLSKHSSPSIAHQLSEQNAHILKANGLPEYASTTEFILLNSCKSAFEALQTLILEAQHSIYLQSYIFERDSIGQRLLELLEQKAQQGIEIRLLFDAIGSFSFYLQKPLLNRLRQAGMQILFFHPPVSALLKGQINFRNHRKIYLFDEKTVVTGGMNLSADYLGSDHTKSWPDILMQANDKVAQDTLEIFLNDWRYSANLPSKKRIVEPPRLQSGQQKTAGFNMQVIPAGSDMPSNPMLEIILNSIFQAKQQILILSPYFIPDSAVISALKIALKRGVAIQLITPNKSDQFLFDLARTSYINQLQGEGAEVLFFNTNMMHAKCMIIDDVLVISGSANLDYRSLHINHEVINLIYEANVIAEMQAWFGQLKQQTRSFRPPQNIVRRLLENLSRIIAPIL